MPTGDFHRSLKFANCFTTRSRSRGQCDADSRCIIPYVLSILPR